MDIFIHFVKKLLYYTSVLLLGFGVLFSPLTAQVQSPEEFVGFKIGQDGKLFGWQTVVDYFWELHSSSDRVTVKELGKTTLGQPFIMAVISSSFNLRNLAKFTNLQKQAANPRHLSEQDARLLARKNKAVVMVTLNIHSTEIASSQESIELAYRLATDHSDRTKRILDNVIILLIPSMNPDGMQRVVDWYRQYVDTEFEGSPLPYLYHHYAGHDNNRDWFMMRLKETRLVSEQIYHEWFPHLIYDQHQMRTESARLFLPPYADPVNPNLHPLLLAQMNKFGKHIVSELQAQNYRGIVTDAFYTAWWEGTSVMTPWWHNMLGILSEVASVHIATPLYFPKGSLRAGRRGLPQYNQRMNFLDPWPGGWWRLRDIIDYELAITFSLLDLAAQEKETLIYNFCKMNLDAIEKGKSEPPYAFVVPASQHDPVTAAQMIDILMQGGVEGHQATGDFFAGNLRFEKGSYVLLLSQPFRPYLKDMLERQTYPDLRDYPGGPPIRPYDMTGWTLPLMMGVKAVQVDEPFEADLERVESITYPTGRLFENPKGGYFISHKSNQSFMLVNRLLVQKKKVFWLKDEIEIDGLTFQPGAVYIPFKEIKPEHMELLAQQFSLKVFQSTQSVKGKEAYRLKNFRLGLYQPFTANMDEGWTRYVLDRFDFRFKSLYNTNLKKSGFKSDFDVIIIPDMSQKDILQGRQEQKADIYTPKLPPQYRGGITKDGVTHLREFVEEGGTLITLDSACDFAIEQFGLPVQNVLKNVNAAEFFCPGSLLHIEVDQSEPVAYGMPSQAAAMFVNSPALRPLHWRQRTGVPASYPASNPLLSGWILGAEKLQGLAAVLDIPMGKGRVILIGFRAQHRAQTPGTYKFLLNAIHLAQAEDVLIER
ncbi:MAG: M14 metallopeptidase family protein [bacterium]